MVKKMLLLIFALFVQALSQIPDQFLRIDEISYYRGTPSLSSMPNVHLLAFEILDHSVTNAEYKAFVQATGWRSPLHWKDGQIPKGFDDYPVIYVNREDVRAYLQWVSEQDNGRMYRLPTTLEYEYAQRSGRADQQYPWGNDDPAGHANYDPGQNRDFSRWQEYLQPARWGKPNGFGLYNMSGNVWNMTIDNHDPATERWKYRIKDTDLLEKSVMGGSWARDASYLRCGRRMGNQPGIFHPDLGFRPVREPDGADWRTVNRSLSGVSPEPGSVVLSWALLDASEKSLAFNVYRATERTHAGFKVNREPVRNSTMFVDQNLDMGERYHYYVRPLDATGQEGRRSEWKGVTVGETGSRVLVEFKPLYKQGNLVPIFGDLDGDGAMDCVIRMDNGNTEMSQDPGLPVQLEAFSSWGRSLWRKDVCRHDHCYGSANNVPFNVWDMDDDGRDEIITRMQIGDQVFVTILDGLTGELKHKAPWPDMVSDFQKSSTRIHMSVAYLDGQHPAVVTQTGLYENEVFVAFDRELNELWRFESLGATNGSGGHKIEVADVDGDGKQEVFNGTTCLNSDGTLRWSIYKQHPDIVSVHDYLPDRPGLEVFYIVESSIHAGVYMVDADDGEIIWKLNREDDPAWTHGHRGWTADIWEGSPGIECISNRQGHNDHHMLLFSASGTLLQEPFPDGYVPIEWDGDLTRELITNSGRTLANYNGKAPVPVIGVSPNPLENGSFRMSADLVGDFRDELVLITQYEDGSRGVAVVVATDAMDKKYVHARGDLEYRLWLARNMGGGYPSVYDRELE